MRRAGTIPAEFVAQNLKRFFWLARARDNSKCPIGDFLITRVPLVGPGKKHGSGEAAAHDAVNMPAEHLGLLLLRMPDCVHAELTQNERTLFRQILQTQQVLLEVVLIVQVNVEAKKIEILRQQIFGWWISRVRKQNIR